MPAAGAGRWHQDAGQLHDLLNGIAAVAGLAGADGLIDAGTNGAAWSVAQLAVLAGLETGIDWSPVPVRVIVSTFPLEAALAAWSAGHPGKISGLRYLPAITVPPPTGR